MSEDWTLRFSMLNLPPEGEFVSFEELEQHLLEDAEKTERKLAETLWDLVRLYSSAGHPKIALPYMERLFLIAQYYPRMKADCGLAAGQLMEKIRDYETAIKFYSSALSAEGGDSKTRYLINNNLGYCLNQGGRYSEAEQYCRAAIEINPQRHNAYKNLGVALEGQSKYAEAARCFIAAVRANAADPRALNHLENLVTSHLEISTEIPDIRDQVNGCREAVSTVKTMRERFSADEEESP